MRGWRHGALAIVLGVLSSCAFGCAERKAGSRHILLVTVDTLRADHVGLYGYRRATTPQIDRFFGDRGRLDLPLPQQAEFAAEVEPLADLPGDLSARGLEHGVEGSEHDLDRGFVEELGGEKIGVLVAKA